MFIRCWGARGSIPVSGREYIKYGGDTTCLEIRTKNDEVIIVDAGSGIRALGNKLIEEKRFKSTILLTHAHWDHIMGFPFFKPIYFRRASITLFGCSFVQESMRHMISKIMEPPYFPVHFDDIKANIEYQEVCETTFSIDSMEIVPIPLSHPNQGVGYKFIEENKVFVFLTDNELGYVHYGGGQYRDYQAFAAGADLLVHDAEYTEEEYRKTKSWGHSIYRDALQLAFDAGVKKFGLFHHNQERTDDEVDRLVSECRRVIKDHQTHLECFALSQNMEIVL